MEYVTQAEQGHAERPKRNYKKEAEWERRNFDVFKFRVSKELGAEFRARLAESDLSASEWFRRVLQLPIPIDQRGEPAEADVAGTSIIDAARAGAGISPSAGTELGPARAPSVSGADDSPKKKRRSASPSPELVAQWASMRKHDGLSYAQIAAASEGYDLSTVRKRIVKELAKDGASANIV